MYRARSSSFPSLVMTDTATSTNSSRVYWTKSKVTNLDRSSGGSLSRLLHPANTQVVMRSVSRIPLFSLATMPLCMRDRRTEKSSRFILSISSSTRNRGRKLTRKSAMPARLLDPPRAY